MGVLMDTNKFEQIKTALDTLKSKGTRAETIIETFQKNWKEKYGFSTKAEAEAFIEKQAQERKETEADIDSLFEELKGLTNWALI